MEYNKDKLGGEENGCFSCARNCYMYYVYYIYNLVQTSLKENKNA